MINRQNKSEYQRSDTTDVIVIGAGLTGSCIALELAIQGYKVALLDQDSVPMNRASRRNEGKIHLGLIYAADPSFSTADLQLQGALTFSFLLKRWIGENIHKLRLSAPFTYLVAGDSIHTPDELAEHYEKVESTYRERLAQNSNLSYLGTQPDYLVRPIGLGLLDSRLNSNHLSAAFSTNELAIDTNQLAELVVRAIAAESNITFCPLHKVREIEPRSETYFVSGESHDETWALQSKQVVNASWENRLKLDSSLGILPPSGWLYRLKYGVLARIPRKLLKAPSATMVLGRYGDVVIRPNGTAFLSWYPAGMCGWSDELEPPEQWGSACKGESDGNSSKIINDTLNGIEPWYPDIRFCKPYQLDAGVIVAYGNSDVDDPGSGLHERTRVGVFSRGGYHSVDPGKLTTAPFFAMKAAERVTSFFSSPAAASRDNN